MYRVALTPDALLDTLVTRPAGTGGPSTPSTPAGPASLSSPAGPDDRERELDRVIEVLRRDGCLDTTPDAAQWLRFGGRTVSSDDLRRTPVVLVGDGRLADLAVGYRMFQDFQSVSRGDPASVGGLVRAVTPPASPPSAPVSPIVVALADHFDYDFLTAIDDHAARAGFRWIPLQIDAGQGWLGPAVTPGQTPHYRDLLGRRFSAASSVPRFHALTNPHVHGRPQLPPESELVWMLAILAAQLRRWAVGAPVLAAWSEVELDPVSFTVTPHLVLPLPDRAGMRPPRHVDLADLVDARTGIVNRLEPVRMHPSVPRSLHVVQSVAGDLRRICGYVNGRLNHGSSFTTVDAARTSAIAEGIERYCCGWVDRATLTQASYQELTRRGEHAVDPEQLVLHSAAQYAAPGFPLVPFTRDLRVHWVPGQCLSCDRPAWVPASLVHVNWYLGRYAVDPPTNYAMFSGVAAGSSWDMAVAACLEELIERDAKMVWWLNGHRLPAVRPTPALEAVWAGAPQEYGQRARLIYIENEFDVPVMAGVVDCVPDGLLTIGFAVRPDPAEAGLKAWAEALALQEMCRLLDDPDSAFWRVTTRLVTEDSLKRPRADRRYLDEYRDDFHDVTTLLSQLQVNLDPRARDRVRGLVDAAPTRGLDSVPRLPARTADTYRERLERRGFEVFAVDLTTPDVAVTDVRVARVVVPGLVPNFPAAFPPFGRRRVYDAAVALGWRDRPREEAEMNTFPMPHA